MHITKLKENAKHCNLIEFTSPPLMVHYPYSELLFKECKMQYNVHNTTERQCKLQLQSYRVHFTASYGCLLSPPPIECPLHLVTVQLWISRVLSTFREWVTNVYFWRGGRFQQCLDYKVSSIASCSKQCLDYKVRLMEILVVSELLTLRVRVTAHKRGSVLLNWLPRRKDKSQI